MKIAVGAFGLAKRDLDVDAEAHRLYKNCSIRGRTCIRAKMDGVARLRSGNNEMRAGAFDTRVALNFGEACLAPARGKSEKREFARLQRFFRIQEIRQELFV